MVPFSPPKGLPPSPNPALRHQYNQQKQEMIGSPPTHVGDSAGSVAEPRALFITHAHARCTFPVASYPGSPCAGGDFDEERDGWWWRRGWGRPEILASADLAGSTYTGPRATNRVRDPAHGACGRDLDRAPPTQLLVTKGRKYASKLLLKLRRAMYSEYSVLRTEYRRQPWVIISCDPGNPPGAASPLSPPP